jgi:serine/threonine protein kinase
MASDHTDNTPRPADEDGVTASPQSPPTADTDPSLAFDLETIWQAVERGSSEHSDPLLGKKFGGVTLVRLIGEGGMGRIYEGEQETPKRAVAVKVQRPGRLDLEHTRRFVREMWLLGRISHPWVCRIYTAGIHEQGGTQFPYFVMEYIPGAEPITLHAARIALPLEQRVRLFRDVCEAVAAGHALGIHHRDLKPANVLVAADGFPKVIDFGVAHACGSDGSTASLTRTGQLIGTIQYSPPELLGGSEADARSDVWSLGMILHELVTGRLPFDVTGMPVLSAIATVGRHDPGLVHTARGRTSQAIAAVVDACLERSPADRPADAADLAQRLSALLATAPSVPAAWLPQTIEEGPARGEGWRRRTVIFAGVTATVTATAVLVGAWRDWKPGLETPAKQTTGSAEGANNSGEELPHPVLPDGSFQTPIASPDFRFGFPRVDAEGADTFLVESTGLRKWHETFATRRAYWAPAETDVEGRLVYRFDLPGKSRRVHLLAHVAVWDDQVTAGVTGRGAGAIEASRDGETWIEIADGLNPPAWGKLLFVDGLLPETCLGSATIWIRVRLLTTGKQLDEGYNVAQFGGAAEKSRTNVFQIDVECEPATTSL